ncbi:hypothetical protein TUM17569_01220 [Klebsiella oxytoca]|nr:hypothetical protein TUM17568_31920 [Klebsiella oxytoca]GJK94661.1 hypothetical protein TUM17569_01220 [Klebsiella oxytoca]
MRRRGIDQLSLRVMTYSILNIHAFTVNANGPDHRSPGGECAARAIIAGIVEPDFIALSSKT